MAEAKNSVTQKMPATVSKRKTGAAKKTKKIKTKLTTTTAAVAEVKVQQKQKIERVVTARHQRMVEKARVRSSMPAPEVIPEVAAVKITDVSGVV